MGKIKNWDSIQKSDPRYDRFHESRFDRYSDPLVWKHQNGELYYITYKNQDGTYVSEQVGEEAQQADKIGYVDDYGKYTSKNTARSKSTEILEDHPYPFGEYGKDELKNRTKQIIKEMYSIQYGKNRDVSIKSLQKRSQKKAQYRDNYGKIELWIDWSDYKNDSVERRITTLSHELAHTEHPHHKPSFWYEFFDIIQNMEGRIDHHFREPVNWEKVRKQAVKDIHKNSLDRRTSTVGEMRAEAEEELNVEVDDNYARSKYEGKINEKVQMKGVGGKTRKSNRNITEYSDKELWEFVQENASNITMFGDQKKLLYFPEVRNGELLSEEDRKKHQIMQMRMSQPRVTIKE